MSMSRITLALRAALNAVAQDSATWLRGRDVFVTTYTDPHNHRSISGALKASMQDVAPGDRDRQQAGIDAWRKAYNVPGKASLKLVWASVGAFVGVVLAIVFNALGWVTGLFPGLALVALVVSCVYAWSFVGDRYERRAIAEINDLQ